MKWRKIKYILFHRSVLAGLALVAQVAVLFVMVNEFTAHFDYFYWFCIFVSFLATVWIVSDRSEPGYKIAWLVVILPFPVFGGILYLLLGGNRISERTRRKMKGIAERSNEVLRGDFKADRLTHLDEDAVGQIRYLERYASCPAYTNTRTEYFPVGDLAFVRMLEELEKAERYIFLEYFILQEGECWNAILDILERKAAAGVEVRLIYDDFGCMFTLPRTYNDQMAARGIQCRVFNRLVPVLTLRMNNRDHRKLCIIDGKVGFTGGMNLADEYINRRVRFGHWKDSAILLRGEAVWSMTVMFLSMWDYCSGWEEDFDLFRPESMPRLPGSGWVQPYTDTPLDHEKVGQAVYPEHDLPGPGLYLYHHALSDRGRGHQHGPVQRRQSGGGCAHHHPPHPGQALRVRGDQGPLSASAGGGGEDLRVHAGLHPRQKLCGGRAVCHGGHREPGLPQPLPPL